jgi:hypothetical protein
MDHEHPERRHTCDHDDDVMCPGHFFLATQTDSWVTYNDETRMFEVIDMDEWEELRSKRGH